MSQCTAPVEGHRTASGAANCPACRYRSSRPSYYSPRPSYTQSPPRRYPSFASRSSSSSSSPSRSRRSSVSYSVSEYQTLNPIHQEVLKLAESDFDRRDLFLCHAWDDREGAALEFYQLLINLDVKVWFSEKDLPLGTPFMRQIDKGLKNSLAGIVLVTPAMLTSLDAEGVADRELSVLLSSGRVIPIAHGTTFEEMREVSPLLASHAGITTSDYSSLDEVAIKIADTVLLD